MDVEKDTNSDGQKTIVHGQAVRCFPIKVVMRPEEIVLFSCVEKLRTTILSPFSAMAFWPTELITQPP